MFIPLKANMKIATYNIDWAKSYRSKKHILKIEALLNKFEFDILVITESVELNLPQYQYRYHTTQLPTKEIYEGLNYGEYLNLTKAHRVSVYSKIPVQDFIKVNDPNTSIALQFNSVIGPLNVYATIIGTWFNKQPYAEDELQNCIEDCTRIFKEKGALCLVGDLNTAFSDEKILQINSHTTNSLLDLCNICNLELTTSIIVNNIDHVFLPKGYKTTVQKFIEKDDLSDHMGIVVEVL